MPKFSVIIPAFCAEATIGETLASVSAQTCGDFEVIVLDDASPDRTAAVVEVHGYRDPRIRLVCLDKSGPSWARNFGVALARGEWIAFLDADDLWPADRLATIAAAVDRPDAPEAVYGRTAFFRNTPEDARTVSSVRGTALTTYDLLCENPVCTLSNLTVRRDAFQKVGGFDIDIVHAEDVEFMLRLAAGGGRIEGIDATLVYYRASDYGLSANLEAMQKGWRRALAQARRLGVPLTDRDVRAAEAVHLRYLARRALRVRSGRLTALSLAIRAIALSPAAYFANPRRGILTLAGACARPFLPASVRRFVL